VGGVQFAARLVALTWTFLDRLLDEWAESLLGGTALSVVVHSGI
jgi:hypothetical protein